MGKNMPVRWAGGAVLLVGVLLGAWALAHHLPWSGKAVQLWSEVDLPPLPENGQNGWIVLRATSERLAKDERPDDLRDVERLDWRSVKARANEIRRFAEGATVRSQEAAVRAALGSPRFADACPLDLESRCQWPNRMRLHDAFTLGVLGSALSGDWDEALEQAARLLRADLEMMRTSRTALSALTARKMVRNDLRCVGVLLDGIESEGRGRAARHRATLALIASVLEPAARPDRAPARAVIAEYVSVTKGIRTLSDVARARAGGDWTMVLVLDREHTIALANEHFEALMRFAESPSTREPPVRARFSRERFGWWLYDAGGKLMLDALLLDLVPALRSIEEQDARIEAASTALRNRISAFSRYASR